MEKIQGRIIKLHSLSKKLTFIHLSTNGKVAELIYEKNDVSFKKGDYIRCKGCWRPHFKNGGEKEFFIEDILLVVPNSIINNAPNFLNFGLKNDKIELNSLRIEVERLMCDFFWGKDYMHVKSPIIVGEWVKGQTGNFELDFYDKKANLTISTMLHHQIIMSQGYEKVFEIAKLFRKENPTNNKRLAEFTNIVIGLVGAKLPILINEFSELIIYIYTNTKWHLYKTIKKPAIPIFETIEYNTLLENCNLKNIIGHQLPKTVRGFMDKTFNGFVWITNFPETTRPFYVRSKEQKCFDCQLWYKGIKYIAAGGETETNIETIKEKIKNENKNLVDYSFLINTLQYGMPPLAGIDMGIERFLATWLNLTPADFTFFPRYTNNLNP